MLVSAHTHSADDRQHDRIPVNLGCQVTFTDRTAHARVRDISYDGARIEMPMNGALYDFDAVTSVHIQNVGIVRATVRWNEDREIGVEFLTPELVRQPIARMMTQRDPRGTIRTLRG